MDMAGTRHTVTSQAGMQAVSGPTSHLTTASLSAMFSSQTCSSATAAQSGYLQSSQHSVVFKWLSSAHATSTASKLIN